MGPLSPKQLQKLLLKFSKLATLQKISCEIINLHDGRRKEHRLLLEENISRIHFESVAARQSANASSVRVSVPCITNVYTGTEKLPEPAAKRLQALRKEGKVTLAPEESAKLIMVEVDPEGEMPLLGLPVENGPFVCIVPSDEMELEPGDLATSLQVLKFWKDFEMETESPESSRSFSFPPQSSASASASLGALMLVRDQPVASTPADKEKRLAEFKKEATKGVSCYFLDHKTGERHPARYQYKKNWRGQEMLKLQQGDGKEFARLMFSEIAYVLDFDNAPPDVIALNPRVHVVDIEKPRLCVVAWKHADNKGKDDLDMHRFTLILDSHIAMRDFVFAVNALRNFKLR
uniref:Uncharacterized protein n=1 Tax=Chromera velia CCMP2878 TaxID=1169474 RepID=A0A0G4H795_9ALVE|mmetsp:Transcript_16231/g.32893  ORF Transcript_16231/g.32893 Transcript_16231/m.32893 type:complete len:348 (+) Transcript_16231:175-1218(+)|eukprot:Cvel_24902.t1-p1 / transcript=Cvel_24902.t1 / gene=Cvel_24902 / organism=Chromera_velia_CCMP2878 / gene_product=hypothetical protein / transcript_product=hypothetical protein / location=Cvel_scaffold2752:20201-23951(+) / protein_length=347 / sequence_SO=supercontig / SO=protein_coding / is_pseudo=false